MTGFTVPSEMRWSAKTVPFQTAGVYIYLFNILKIIFLKFNFLSSIQKQICEPFTTLDTAIKEFDRHCYLFIFRDTIQ
jgi:hypothetical protein